MKRYVVIGGALAVVAVTAIAQGPEDEVTSGGGFLVNFLENQISGPGRQIGLSGVSGVLSSQARIERITVSDENGPWMVIEDVEIDWSRTQLLRARLQVNRLHIGEVTWLRRGVTPPPAPGLPTPEARPFTVPELPVSVRLEDLALQRLAFDEAVFGMAAELSAGGSLVLEGGTLDTDINVTRLDGPGGELALDASFSNATRALDIDLNLSEPAGGVVATALNIEGTPAIDLSVTGSGPLDNVDIELALDAGGERLAGGTVALRGADEGLGFDAQLTGAIAPLVPPDFRDFFGGETAILARGVNKTGGGLRLDRLDVSGAALTLGGRLETGSDGFLRSLDLSGRLGDPADAPVRLPVPGAETLLNSATLRVEFGAGDRWSGLVVLDRLQAGGLEMEDVTLTMGGRARNLEDPALRDVTVVLEGLATGVWSPDPAVAAAIGTRMDLFADVALVPGGTVDVRQAQFGGNGLSAFTTGRFAEGVYSGRGALRAANIGVFEGLAGRRLGGALALTAEGSVTPLDRAFDLTFDGSANDLTLGDDRLDRLLAGETTLGGRAVRDELGFRTQNLRLDNPQLSFVSDGQIASTGTDFGFEARLADLALLDPRATGALAAQGRASGQGGPLDLSLSAMIAEGSLIDRPLSDFALGFDGRLDGQDLTGNVTGGGSFDALALDLGAGIAIEGGRREISGLRLAVGPNLLTGNLTQTDDAPVEGELVLNAPDVAPLAAMALVEATGTVETTIVLSASDPGQGARLTGRADELAVGANRIGALVFDFTVTDALGLPLIAGAAHGRDIAAAGFDVATIGIDAQQLDAARMRVSLDSELAIGTRVETVAELERLDAGFAATLQQLLVNQGDLSAALTAPSTVTVADGAVTLTPLALDLGNGRLTAQGSFADEIDLSLDLSALPLAIANTILPQLGLGGELTGTARITGPRSAPDVRFDIAGHQVTSAQTAATGLPPLTIAAQGQTTGGRLGLNASVTAQGLAATAQGELPLGTGGMDLRIGLQSFPLGLIDRVAGNRGLAGTVTGNAHVTGAYADPTVTFQAEGTGLGLAMLRENGLPALNLSIDGGFQGGAITLNRAQAGGAPGLALNGSGRIPLQGSGLDLRLTGTVPINLADSFLAGRLAQASGALQVDATVTGALASPQFNGNLSVNGGTFVDPTTNIRIDNLRMDAGLSGQTLTLRDLAGTVGGGTIGGTGTLTIDPARGFPADLAIRIANVRYTDGAFVTTTVDGNLTLIGPIQNGGVLGGRIDLGHTEISVAEGLGFGGQATLDEVTHFRPPPRVQETLRRAAVGAPSPPQPGRGALVLDLRITAPNQIFVRGRGLDVEVGGELRLTGPTNDIQPIGQFDLRRGRLNLIGQRIEFQEGSVQLVGDLDPRINFVARTRSGDVTAIVTVSGRASSPDITFSSDPPLPQDEVLSHVLFNRTTQNLSPFQAAQLAAAAAELAGQGGNGLMSQIRSSLGFDDLDIITDEDGETAVRAGRYLSDEVYLDVQTAPGGESRVELTYEINERLTARGSVGSDGNTTLGIFFERDF